MHEIYGLGLGTALLRGLALEHDVLLLHTLFAVAARSQFRHMATPGGFRMSVAITNSGSLGWVTAVDPETQALWPPMRSHPWNWPIQIAHLLGAGGFDDPAVDSALFVLGVHRRMVGRRCGKQFRRSAKKTERPAVKMHRRCR
jgi:alkylated DNA repair dioxygenase AlkB